MKTININLEKKSYPIYVGENIIENYDLFEKHISGNKVAIVTNDKVASLYLQKISNTLSIEKEIIPIILPDGEAFKNTESLNLIYDRLLAGKANRQTTLLALGGGVIGDMTGFAAATFMRGVDFIQIPSTLLSQVDSSVGGKTGINHPSGKNMIGAFYQPCAVLSDTNVLSTLPEREFSAGLAEVIKYGLIRDRKFYEWLEKNIELVMSRDSRALTYTIERSCTNKAEVVAEDEKESGIRATLNLGHTFGHSIETALSYKGWLHGEAVGCGMLMAADLSMRLDLIDQGRVDRVKALLERAKLPIKIPRGIILKDILENMKVDKKSRNGILYLILLNDIGKATITADYTQRALTETINHFLE